MFDRDVVKSGYITNNNQYKRRDSFGDATKLVTTGEAIGSSRNRTGHILKSKFEYEIVCKVEL